MLRALFRLIFSNLLGNFFRLLGNLPRLLRRKPGWLRLDVKQPLPARPRRVGFIRKRVGPSLDAVVRLCEELGKDAALTGVVVRLESLGGGWAHLESLRGAFASLRAAGKRVVFHLSSPSHREYFVATAGDSILIDESGPLGLVGLSAEVTFWGGALDKLGALPEAEYRGAYKSFAETFLRRDMSPAQREAQGAILDHLQATMSAALAGARKVSPERARELFEGGPYLATEAEKAGLVNGVRYLDEVPEYLGIPAPRLASPSQWRRARLRPLVWKPLLGGPRSVQVVALHGMIVSGEGGGFPRRSLGGDAAVRTLEAARKDRRVAAVVLHVDSRGGSAAASDLIWRETVRLAREKPVVACFDDVAASGGYYLACPATKIVAQPSTLTGSIGVVAGKLSFAGLRERLGLGTEILTRGPAAAMNSTARGYSTEERRRLAAEVNGLYQQFVRKVAEGRHLTLEAAEAVAQGRVWTGAAARERGLVDELGGVDVALRLAKELGRRRPGERLAVEDVHVSAKRDSLFWRLVGDRAERTLRIPAAVAELIELGRLAEERACLVLPLSFWD